MARGPMSDKEWAYFETFVTETRPKRGRRASNHLRSDRVNGTLKLLLRITISRFEAMTGTKAMLQGTDETFEAVATRRKFDAASGSPLASNPPDMVQRPASVIAEEVL